MRFDAHFGDAEAVQLKAAILLYGGATRITFASVHEPYRDPEGGAPYLDAGRPISIEFLRTLARGLGLGMAPEILPECVVMRTPEVAAWWAPAAVRPMFLSETSDGKTLNGQPYPHPPLVFVVDGGHGLSVRALMENCRPGPRSAIAIAPYWNVNEAGGVCLGSMVTPRLAGLASLGEWVEGFFQSEFTHAGNVKITCHDEGRRPEKAPSRLAIGPPIKCYSSCYSSTRVLGHLVSVDVAWRRERHRGKYLKRQGKR